MIYKSLVMLIYFRKLTFYNLGMLNLDFYI